MIQFSVQLYGEETPEGVKWHSFVGDKIAFDADRSHVILRSDAEDYVIPVYKIEGINITGLTIKA